MIATRDGRPAIHHVQEDIPSSSVPRVNWFLGSLSINYEHVPDQARKAGKRTFRSLTIENKEIEFSEGFTDLRIVSYQHILDGKGFGIGDAKASIGAGA